MKVICFSEDGMRFSCEEKCKKYEESKRKYCDEESLWDNDEEAEDYDKKYRERLKEVRVAYLKYRNLFTRLVRDYPEKMIW